MIGEDERSLAGGLRYSLQGGSFEAYRDLFQWVTTPSVAEFQLAVEQAFAAWTAVDPATGLYTDLSFVADLSTPVVGTGTFNGFDAHGAEIDLFAADAGDIVTRAVAKLDAIEESVMLTSGTANYPGSAAISGADITINNNSGAKFRLDFFRRLLAHEIGHALGLGDVEDANSEAEFIDDNYDGSSSETALATLTNSWAMLVNPLNPAVSPLDLYVVANGNPGVDTPGVNILMESQGLGIAVGNPETSLFPLVNDDFGTRQFLYPSLVRDVELAGDYNGDGIVDAADYTTWRDQLGALISLPNETATFGSVTEEDYEVWTTNFGAVAAEMATASTGYAVAVSEPASVLLLTCAVPLFWQRR
jgi:hypothetical protein